MFEQKKWNIQELKRTTCWLVFVLKRLNNYNLSIIVLKPDPEINIRIENIENRILFPDFFKGIRLI